MNILPKMGKIIQRLWKKEKLLDIEKTPKNVVTNLLKTKDGLYLEYGTDLIITCNDKITRCQIYDVHNDMIYELPKSGIQLGKTHTFRMESSDHPSTLAVIENHHLPGGRYEFIAWWSKRGQKFWFRVKFTQQNHPIPVTTFSKILNILVTHRTYPDNLLSNILESLEKAFPNSES